MFSPLFPQGAKRIILPTLRQVLVANRTYYVRTDGSDRNSGLSNSAGGAFLTVQKAINVIASTLDIAGYTVTVQIGDGTYTGGMIFTTAFTGGGIVVFQGNSTTPANVLFNMTSAEVIAVRTNPVSKLQFKNFKGQTTTGGVFMNLTAGCLVDFSGLDFGACADHHISIYDPGVVCNIIGNYTISGGTGGHWVVQFGVLNQISGVTVTLTGTPAFSLSFMYQDLASIVYNFPNIVFSGSATGKRYTQVYNCIFQSASAGANYLPGNVAGTSGTGSIYA